MFFEVDKGCLSLFPAPDHPPPVKIPLPPAVVWNARGTTGGQTTHGVLTSKVTIMRDEDPEMPHINPNKIFT